MRQLLCATALCLAAFCLPGCSQRMEVEPRWRGLAASEFFADGASARPIVAGTVARSSLREDEHFYAGTVGGAYATTFPFPVTFEILERGQDRFNIYCAPCHGRAGDGDGMIVQRGLRGPVDFAAPRFQTAPAGYLFDVITRGRGAMFPYAYRVDPADRWAIVAYIRALQFSRKASSAELAPEDLRALEKIQ